MPSESADERPVRRTRRSDDTSERTSARKKANGRRVRRPEKREAGAGEVARRARAHVGDLIDRPVEGVSGIRRTDEGWEVRVDVVEVGRIPDTTSLLATYELVLDSGCELMGYRRVARFRRGDTAG